MSAQGEIEHSILYDAIGNVVNDGIGAYTCDLRNKLLEQAAATAGSTSEVRYRYDARGYRVLATSLVAGGGGVDWLLEPGGEQLVERTFDQSGQKVGEAAFVSFCFRVLAWIEGTEVKHVVSKYIGFPVLVADGTGAILWHGVPGYPASDSAEFRTRVQDRQNPAQYLETRWGFLLPCGGPGQCTFRHF